MLFFQLWLQPFGLLLQYCHKKIMVSSSQAYEISFKALIIKSRTISLFSLLNFKPSRLALSTFASSAPVQESKGPVFKWDRAPSSSMPTAFTPTAAKLQVSKPVLLTSQCQIFFLLSEKHLLLIICFYQKRQAPKPFIFNCSAYVVPWQFEIHSLKFLIKMLYDPSHYTHSNCPENTLLFQSR